MSIQVDTTNWVRGKNYPEYMDDIAISMISKGYLLPDEDVFDAFRRVSKAAARRLKRKDLQPFFYEAIVKNWLCLASPVLSNLGTERGMPISCFGIDNVFFLFEYPCTRINMRFRCLPRSSCICRLCVS